MRVAIVEHEAIIDALTTGDPEAVVGAGEPDEDSSIVGPAPDRDRILRLAPPTGLGPECGAFAG